MEMILAAVFGGVVGLWAVLLAVMTSGPAYNVVQTIIPLAIAGIFYTAWLEGWLGKYDRP